MDCQTLLIGLLIILLCLLLKKYFFGPKNLPPGPIPFPIFGSVHLVVPNFIRNIPKLTSTYGDIVGLTLLGKQFLIIQGYALIKEAIMDRPKTFANRAETLVLKLRGETIEGIATVPYSPQWGAKRKLFHVAMRNMGLNKHGIGTMIEEELPHFAKKLSDMAEENLLMDPAEAFDFAVLNVLASFTFGNRYSYGDSKFRDLLENNNMFFHKSGNLLGFGFAIASLVPYLSKFWLPQSAQETKDCCEKIKGFIAKEIKYHMKTIDKTNPRDFIDYYLIEMESDDKLLFTQEGLEMTILDLFQAGTETTSTTLRWAVLYMANNLEIQDKIHEEIVKEIGKDKTPAYKDRVKLPYTEAAILEVQRKATIGPIGVAHASTIDCELKGYHISKGTVIMPYFPSIHYSSKHWKNPHHFDPKNFLEPDGKVGQREAFMPFGGGLRICLGMEIAKQELFLFFAVMVQRFRFLPPEGVNKLCEDAIEGATLRPRPFKVRIETRFERNIQPNRV